MSNVEFQNNTEELNQIDEAINTLASALHEQWRETRKQDNGSYESRIKSTSDEAWIASHDGATEVDIANTSYEDLPVDWQEENHTAAQVAIDVMLPRHSDATMYSNLSVESSTRSEVGNAIHDAWLSRNEWARGGELGVPFDELPKDEQDKDIAQAKLAAKIIKDIDAASDSAYGPNFDSDEEALAWLEEPDD